MRVEADFLVKYNETNFFRIRASFHDREVCGLNYGLLLGKTYRYKQEISVFCRLGEMICFFND